MENDYSPLIGKRVMEYKLTADHQILILFFIDGTHALLEVDEDCCSHSWIESLDLPNNLFGTISKVEDIPMPDLGNINTEKHKKVACVKYYGLKITTNRGSCVIDYRNDSNGYYGGSIYLRKGNNANL